MNDPFEAAIVHDLPNELTCVIGKVIVAFARLEYTLTAMSGLLLQLNKAEARIALRTPRATDRLDMALDLFAIKALVPVCDTAALRELIEKAAAERDALAHGIWLHDDEKGLFLRLSRGQWPKSMTRGAKISRTVFPQSIPYGVERCKEALVVVERAMAGVDELGAELDVLLRALPDRFRTPAPNLNPLGHRKPTATPARRGSSRGKRKK